MRFRGVKRMSKKAKDRIGYLVNEETKLFLDTVMTDKKVCGMKIEQLQQDKEGKLYMVFNLTDVMKLWGKNDKI